MAARFADFLAEKVSLGSHALVGGVERRVRGRGPLLRAGEVGGDRDELAAFFACAV